MRNTFRALASTCATLALAAGGAAAALTGLGLPTAAWAADAPAKPQFMLSIPSEREGATFALKRAAKGECSGEDLSPPLAWTGVPAGTKSFAVVMFDPDGSKGLGIVHWIRYGIPADLDQLAEGAGTATDAPGMGGKNTQGTTRYHGPCPPVGDVAHHYVIQIYALDLVPDALPVGLSREVLDHAMLGHILAATSIVQRYGR